MNRAVDTDCAIQERGRMRARCEKVLTTTLVALSVCLASGTAAAQDEGRGGGRESARTLYEITPFVGYRLGGDFDFANTIASTRQRANLEDHGSFALALGVRRDDSSQYELLYTREETQLEKTSPLAPL